MSDGFSLSAKKICLPPMGLALARLMEDRDIKWVRQEEPMGCVAAALAMILGITYHEAAAMFKWERSEGRYCPSELYLILERQGWRWRHTSAREREADGDTIPGSLCLALVKAGASIYHAVIVLSDGAVLDPATPHPKKLSDYSHVGGMSVAIAPKKNIC